MFRTVSLSPDVGRIDEKDMMGGELDTYSSYRWIVFPLVGSITNLIKKTAVDKKKELDI